MKKLLRCTFCCFFLSLSAYSQYVDVIGVGLKNKDNEQINFDDPDKIKNVQVFVTSKGKYTDIPLNGVIFDNELESAVTDWEAITGNEYLSEVIDNSIGVYKGGFESGNDGKFNVKVSSEMTEFVHSFYAFASKKDLTNEFRSYSKILPTFHYHNGASNPYIYNVRIHNAEQPRKVRVKIPISELDDTSRMVVIKIKAGNIRFETEETTFNRGDSFFMGTYTLDNVPGNVSNISVSIHSPGGNSVDEENGDSFFIGGVVVDVEKVGCTLTQGYWKTHSDCKKNGNGPKRDNTWDYIGEGDSPESTTMFYKSNQSYCDVYNSKPNNQNGKYYILAHQYIATELNLYNNSDPTDIADTFNKATKFLEKYTPSDVKNDKNVQQEAVKLGGLLDDYNNGKTGAGHCDDNDNNHDEVEQKMLIKEQNMKNRIKLFPNPIESSGQLSFNTPEAGESNVDLFNLNGQKLLNLFNGESKKEGNISINFNEYNLKEGLYIVVIKNGNHVSRHKISVSN